MNILPGSLRPLALLLALLSTATPALHAVDPAFGPQPQIVSAGVYTSLADTTTTATAQSAPFASFSTLPAINGSNVVFTANNSTGVFSGTATARGAVTIADTSTTAINQNTPFSSSGFGVPVVSGGNVAFTAYYNGNANQGIFSGTVGIRGATTVADYTTTAVSQTTTFSSFITPPALSGGNVVYVAAYTGGRGIFTGAVGTKGAATVADYTTTAVNQTTPFSFFASPAISGNNVAFAANYSGGRGIFTGTVGAKGAATVADYTTVATNQNSPFIVFGSPVISGSNVAFLANNSESAGIFTGTVGTKGAATVVDYNTTAAGQTTTFSGLFTPMISGTNVVFAGVTNNNANQGIFLGTAGTKGALTLADYNTTAPGRGLFTSFGATAISGSTVAFTAVSYVAGSSGTIGNGLFLSQNGTLSDIAAVGEPFFGSTITSLAFSPSGLDGSTLTFEYVLANGVSGVGTFSLAAVPEPATWAGGALLLASAGLSLRRRTRAS